MRGPKVAKLAGEARILRSVVRDLQDLHRRHGKPRGDVRLGVGGKEHVRRPVRRREDDGVQVRILGRAARVRRPQDAQDEPSYSEARSCANDAHGNAARSAQPPAPPRAPARSPREPGSRIWATRSAANDVGRAADVVALRVREYERRERADAHAGELPRDVCLRRALIDEDAGSRRLEQDRVALADVEERHAQARWRIPRRRRTSRDPGGRDDGECGRSETDGGKAPRMSAHTLPYLAHRKPADEPRTRRPASAVRAPTCALGRSATTRATSSSQAAAQPASDARPAAAVGETGSTIAASRPRPRTSGAATNATTFASTVYDGRLAEVDEDDRRRREPAGERDGERVCDADRQRIPVEPAPDTRDGDEDRRDRRERELEAGLEQRRRHPRHQHERSRPRGSASGREAAQRARRETRVRRQRRRERPTAASRPRARRRR